MTTPIRRVAGGLTVLEALWAALIQFQEVAVSCPSGGCPWPSPYLLHSPAMLVLMFLLLGVGLAAVWGASVAYSVGALLSAATALIMGYSAWTDGTYGYLQGESQLAWIGAGLAVAALALDLVAARSRVVLSEQANPMNLPVFG